MPENSRTTEIAAMRKDYMQRGLDESELDPDPLKQFADWFQEARGAKVIPEPNAMVLSTVSPEGKPSGRFVLLKGIEPNGFLFFTNFRSAKGQDLSLNPHAALTFGWIELERQVRIEGEATPAPRSAVESYFKTRPRGSRLGAWASPQSKVIPNREYLVSKLDEAEKRFLDDVPPPPEWGGYILTPESVEFWQGRTNRLHDRLRYRKVDGKWIIERLAP